MIFLYYNMIIFASCIPALLALQGSRNSICFHMKRHTAEISIGPQEKRTVVQWVSEGECCLGYLEKNDFCEPQCEPRCKHGMCVEPNTCECYENYKGFHCDILVCPDGYRGKNCSEECLPGTYGKNCGENCTCLNGDCDPINGFCYCHPGWSGIECSIPCLGGLVCQNGGICNADNTCDCQQGYIGDRCEKTCDEGHWGPNCRKKCNCPDDSYICNLKTGECEEKCKHGEYFNGDCWCEGGWEGEFCNQKVCKKGYYGKKCDQICPCQGDTTKICDRITGECICQPGWLGENCTVSCPYMAFGENCSQNCSCQDGRHNGCDAATGICNCIDPWTGKTCDRECKCKEGVCDRSGECVCDPGWQGRYCTQPCDDGYYGDGCTDSCGLYGEEENYICHPIHGPICAPGFMGENCKDHCGKGTYGLQCKHNCSCEYSDNCDRVTGKCVCEPGWHGEKCDLQCSTGFYGLNCKKECIKCWNCRPTDGYCPCQLGWQGKHCQKYCPVEYYDEFNNLCVEEGTPFGTRTVEVHQIPTYQFLVVTITLLIMLSSFTMIFLYMRKSRTVQRNSYITDRSEASGSLPTA